MDSIGRLDLGCDRDDAYVYTPKTNGGRKHDGENSTNTHRSTIVVTAVHVHHLFLNDTIIYCRDEYDSFLFARDDHVSLLQFFPRNIAPSYTKPSNFDSNQI